MIIDYNCTLSAGDMASYGGGGGEDMQYDINDDDELRALIAEEAQLIWEEEELIAISKWRYALLGEGIYLANYSLL